MPKLKEYTDKEFKRYMINSINRIERKLDAMQPDFLKDEKETDLNKYVKSIFSKNRKAS